MHEEINDEHDATQLMISAIPFGFFFHFNFHIRNGSSPDTADESETSSVFGLSMLASIF